MPKALIQATIEGLRPAAGSCGSSGQGSVAMPTSCGVARGYYDVKASGIACSAAKAVLEGQLSKRGQRFESGGFACLPMSHAPGGQGFPIGEVCTKGSARIAASVVDGPA